MSGREGGTRLRLTCCNRVHDCGGCQVKLYLGDHGVRSLRFSKTASGVRFDVEASCEDSPLADFLCYHEPIPVWHKYLGTEAEVISGIKISDCQSIRGDFILQYEATEDGSRGAGFLNVSNATVDRKWSSSAPAWRIACNGLAVEGKCFNQNCKAHNSNVIHKWGLKSFDLLKDAESVRCPMCATNIRPNNFGFSNCSYKIVAASPSFNPTVYTKSWTTVGDCYRTYSDTSEEITYERLQVHVRQPSRTLTPSGTSPAQDSTVGMAIPPPDDCAICMEPLRNRLQTTSCGHSFHSTCINKFASYCARDGRACLCPLCRAEFRTR